MTECNVFTLESVSGLKAMSSPVSISIVYSFYLQPIETEGLFFFVSAQTLSDPTSMLQFYRSLILFNSSKHPHTDQD